MTTRAALRELRAEAEKRGHRLGAFVRGVYSPRWRLARCEACWMTAAVGLSDLTPEGRRGLAVVFDGLARVKDCNGTFDIDGSNAEIARRQAVFRARQKAAGIWVDA